VVGYVGGVHQWVDQQLLVDVARRMPQASFVLVGPQQTDTSVLEACPNVHLLGKRTHQEVPHYLKSFDVGMVPYRLSEYTSHVYPTKLNEYLAMGLPVVATDLPEIRRFNAEHGEIVQVVSDSADFLEAIKAVREPSPEQLRRRITVAQHNSWETRVARMLGLIDGVLAARTQAVSRWEETLRQWYGATRRQAVRIFVTLAVLWVLAFHTPLVWMLAAPLRIVQSPRSADVIVVFAGGVGESGQAGQGYEERVKYAVELYKAGYAPHLIFSSGYVYAFNEPEVMKALAVFLGVPGQAIELETAAKSTYEHVRNVKALLDAGDWHHILLVSAPYHMRRVALVAHRIDPARDIRYVPVPNSLFYDHSHGTELKHLRALWHEYLALLSYWFKGHI